MLKEPRANRAFGICKVFTSLNLHVPKHWNENNSRSRKIYYDVKPKCKQDVSCNRILCSIKLVKRKKNPKTALV